MPWAFIVIGLVASVFGAWSAGDERATCRARASSDTDSRPSADCTIVRRDWMGHHVSSEQSAREVEEFRADVERSPASDPNDPPNITHSLALVTHDGSRYRVKVDDPSEAEVGAGRGRQWLSSGMHGDYVFAVDGSGKSTFGALIGGGCILGGLVGLWLGRKKPTRKDRRAPKST
jgi:hypothetical protein